MSIDIVKLVIAVTSYCHIDNYDAHIKLRVASKAYRICTENINTNVIFNVTVEQQNKGGYTETTHKVCGVVHDLYKPAVIICRSDTRTYKFYYDGKLHRPTLTSHRSYPAHIVTHINGTIIYKEYHVDGKLHREDGPACENHEYLGYEYYRNGFLHREDGPAFARLQSYIEPHLVRILKYGPAGSVEMYYIDGKLHRENGPAVIYYPFSCTEGRIIYYKNGKIHRENGPAGIHYHATKTGYDRFNVKRETYYVDDKQHRIDGPAVIYYNRDGSIEKEIYYIDNQRISYEQFMLITSC